MVVAGLSREDQKKYQRRKDDADKPDAPTDILVATTQQPTEYVKKALTLFGEIEEEGAEKHRSITLMGRGKAVATVVQVAEFLKRRVKGLHQISKIENKVVKDVWVPKEAHAEEGLKEVEVERTVAGMHIQLSLDALDTSSLGYQAPLPEEEVTETGSELKRAQAPRNKKSKGKSGGAKSNGGGGGGGGGGGAAGGRGAKGGRGAGLGRGGRGSGESRGRGPIGRGGGRGKN